ncbi:16930_t:CDS:2, partial [Funneliformis geosporum]
QEGALCDYEKHDASIVSEKVIIPSSINAKKSKINNECSHPKHRFYISTAKNGTEMKNTKKALKQLIDFFELPQEAMMCRYCLYKTDTDPEYINLFNYPQAIESNCRAFQKTVSSFNGIITDENINELNVIDTKTGDTNNNEDFIIDNNIDLQFKRAINVLT